MLVIAIKCYIRQMINCYFEDGCPVSVRPAGTEAIILKDNKILMIKRSQDSYAEPGKWSIAGGFMEFNETLEQSIRREVLEETGYCVKDLTLLRIIDNPDRPNSDRQVIVFVYFCEADKKVAKPDNESSEQKWFDLDRLPPKEQIAFDHYDDIELYKRYLREKYNLPFLNNL